MSLPIIAIVGRPNVGKSTLFNRLIGQRKAITSPIPGTTRDRVYHEAEIAAYRVILVDTGGMEFEKKHDIEADVQTQARIAVEEADIIYLVIDATQPLTASDLDCAQYLRKSKKTLIVIANKTDNKKAKDLINNIYELGLGDPIELSSIHNLGIEDLEKITGRILKKLRFKKHRLTQTSKTHISIVGKPNVGKSSLINALLGQNRLIVSEKPGTTIDATDTPLRWNNHNFVLIDTAGLRRRGKIGKGVEHYGVLRALRSISESDVACLILDFANGLTNQDLHISQYILEAGKGLIIVVNKSDLMKDPSKDQKEFMALLHYRMNYMPWAPVIFISATNKKNIFKILELSRNIADERKKKIPDAKFEMFAKITTLSHPAGRSGRVITISKGLQTGICPPTFTFFTNQPDLIHFSYRRFLENEIRRKFGFYGTAIKLEFRK